jgi:hypothetical protein
MQRSEVAQRFAESDTPWKTFVLDVHADQGPASLLADVSPEAVVTQGDDVHMLRVTSGEVDLVVDTLEDRYWSVHTWRAAAPAHRFLNDLVQTQRCIDWTWLAAGHLQRLWGEGTPLWMSSDYDGDGFLPEADPARRLRIRLHGNDPQSLLAQLASTDYAGALAVDQVGVHVREEAFDGHVKVWTNRRGRFVGRGDSFELFQDIIARAVQRYRETVELIEKRRLRWSGVREQGARLDGAAVALAFDRPVSDISRFLGALFSSREPFRLWALPRVRGNTWTAEAVDLHIGHRLRLEGGDTWLRVLLPASAYGNSVVRLFANLQHAFDPQVRFEDPQIQASIEALQLTPVP